jgi:hypothetical protein
VRIGTRIVENKDRMVRRGGLSALALLAVLGMNLWASGGGSLLGTITDPSGTVVPGALITATDTATAAKQTITSDGRGFYSFHRW